MKRVACAACLCASQPSFLAVVLCVAAVLLFCCAFPLCHGSLESDPPATRPHLLRRVVVVEVIIHFDCKQGGAHEEKQTEHGEGVPLRREQEAHTTATS